MSGSRDNQSRILLDRLTCAVEHLAWPADQQRVYLANLGVAPLLDELALEFDDAFKPIRAALYELGIDDSTRRDIGSIDLILTELTEESKIDDSVWNTAALDNDKRWLDIRQLAKTVQAELKKVKS
jgi:hypothetical protein